MQDHPDAVAIDLDELALNASGAKQLIRFATPAEECRYRELCSVPFNVLSVTVTVTGIIDGMLSLRYLFHPYSLPDGARPELPSDPQVIAEIDEGRGVIMRTPRGYELKSRGGWSTEQLAAALAYVTAAR